MKRFNRLRKIVREEARANGHELGYFVTRSNFSIAYCIKCTLPGWFSMVQLKDLLSPTMLKQISPSGRMFTEIYPPRADGHVGGPVLL